MEGRLQMSSNPIGKEFWETKHSDNESWWISSNFIKVKNK